MRAICAVTFALCAALSLSACAAVDAVGTVASVAGSAVSTAADVTGDVVSTTAGAVTGSSKDSSKKSGS